jgi:L-malate glycosyltransferase
MVKQGGDAEKDTYEGGTMKILLFAPGRSIHTHKWATFFKNKNHDIRVVTFQDHFSEENAKEVHTYTLKKLLPGKLSYFSSVGQLKKVLKEFQPDIFHAHYVSSYGFVGALVNYHPFYISVWGRDIYQFPQQGKMNKQMVDYSLRKADVICSTSHVMAKETQKYTSKPIPVTPFGVDLAKFKPNTDLRNDQQEITIGTVKALSDKYGIGDLIKAFHRIQAMAVETRLLIVGDGPQREEYEELCKSLGIESKVTFTGKVPNNEVPNYINKMSIFAVPSTEDSESFGVAAVEAQACGVPVVVSNVGGLPEVVKNGETGYVVPKENPVELAKAFSKLLEDQQLRIEMGQKGVEHVAREYNWLNNAQSMLELYEQSLSKGSVDIK